MGVAVDHARDVVIGRASKRFQHVVRVSELSRNFGRAAVVEEGLENRLGKELAHFVNTWREPLEVRSSGIPPGRRVESR
jgi:hypothetical protein